MILGHLGDSWNNNDGSECGYWWYHNDDDDDRCHHHPPYYHVPNYDCPPCIDQHDDDDDDVNVQRLISNKQTKERVRWMKLFKKINIDIDRILMFWICCCCCCCFTGDMLFVLIRDIVICLIHVRTYVAIINSQEAETNESCLPFSASSRNSFATGSIIIVSLISFIIIHSSFIHHSTFLWIHNVVDTFLSSSSRRECWKSRRFSAVLRHGMWRSCHDDTDATVPPETTTRRQRSSCGLVELLLQQRLICICI